MKSEVIPPNELEHDHNEDQWCKSQQPSRNYKESPKANNRL